MERIPVYALIYKNEIMNRFECDNYEKANIMARAALGDDAFAVDTSNYATVIGDKYDRGIFYTIFEDGTLQEIEYIPTDADKISDLEDQLLQAKSVLVDTYEEKAVLEDKVLQLEQIIVEMHEKMEGTE